MVDDEDIADLPEEMVNLFTTVEMLAKQTERRQSSLTTRIEDRIRGRVPADWPAIAKYWKWLWAKPDEFEAGESEEYWQENPSLALFQLGVLFGIEYERAYPTGREDEWPVPLDERPDPTEDADD